MAEQTCADQPELHRNLGGPVAEAKPAYLYPAAYGDRTRDLGEVVAGERGLAGDLEVVADEEAADAAGDDITYEQRQELHRLEDAAREKVEQRMDDPTSVRGLADDVYAASGGNPNARYLDEDALGRRVGELQAVVNAIPTSALSRVAGDLGPGRLPDAVTEVVDEWAENLDQMRTKVGELADQLGQVNTAYVANDCDVASQFAQRYGRLDR